MRTWRDADDWAIVSAVKHVTLDHDVIARAIWGCIHGLVVKSVLAESDITVPTRNGQEPSTLEEHLQWGGKVLDGIIWFQDGKHSSATKTISASDETEFQRTSDLAKMALMQLVIFVLIKGHYPSSTGTTIGKDIPAFLHTVCSMNYSPAELASRVASFNLNKLPGDWVRGIPFAAMGEEFLNRFSLGVAGYRLLAAFRVIKPKARTNEQIAALDWIFSRLMEPSSWKLLPITRPPVLKRLGSLNTALTSLMLEVYTREEVQRLKDEGVIAIVSVKKAGGMALWSSILKGDWKLDPIFPDATQGMLPKGVTTEYYTVV